MSFSRGPAESRFPRRTPANQDLFWKERARNLPTLMAAHPAEAGRLRGRDPWWRRTLAAILRRRGDPGPEAAGTMTVELTERELALIRRALGMLAGRSNALGLAREEADALSAKLRALKRDQGPPASGPRAGTQ